jgi:leucyl aminopeptidase
VAATYPAHLTQRDAIEELQAHLNVTNINQNLQVFSSFNNRYYQSATGNLSAEWLLAQAKSYLTADSPVSISIFQHVYRQSSIIAKIPGKSTKTIVVGAHQDSINGEAGGNRTTAKAPGAGEGCSCRLR